MDKRCDGCLVERTAKMKQRMSSCQLEDTHTYTHTYRDMALTCTHIWGCLSTAVVLYICGGDTVGTRESFIMFNRASIAISSAVFTRSWLSSISLRVELSMGVQRCLCCLQQREAESFRSLAGHFERQTMLDSNTLTNSLLSQTSSTSVEVIWTFVFTSSWKQQANDRLRFKITSINYITATS